MAEDTPGATAPSGETATPASISNDVSTTTAPATDNGSTAEVERLRKELEQKTMRENQLRNELEAKTKAEEAAKQKQMEDQQDLAKTVSALQAKLDERDAKNAEQERHATLQQATNDVLKEYPKEVQELAETAGLSLTDDSEDAKKALVEKLDVFKARVAVPTAQVSANNPYRTAPADFDRNTVVHRESPTDGSVMAMEAAKGNLKPTMDYISSLPAVQRMKEISRGA